MFRVIDTFRITDAMLREYPDMRERYAQSGVIAVLDPAEAPEPAPFVGRLVRVHRPDGSVAEHRPTLADRPSSAVGLFFPHLAESDVPRLSAIELLRDSANI